VNSRGIPENQVNLGLPFWGKRYDASDINESFTGTVVDKRYYEIPELIGNGWTYQWDSDAYCPYLAKDDQTKILTFDDPESIRHKCEYALERELGGVMIWALGYDVTGNGQELIQSINENYLENNDTNADIIPTHLSLHAYPNPFNPVCNIEIELAMEEHVQLNVFSVNGQHLATLVDDRLQKGRYSFAWNGRNEKNGNMSSSLYFVKLAGEKSHIVKKVIYLK
jgi:chitinase